MDIFIVVPLGGGSLFFLGLFLLFILEGISETASSSAILFINEHIVTIAIILGVFVILATVYSVLKYKDVHDLSYVTVSSVFFTVGSLLVFAQLATVLVRFSIQTFSHYDGLIVFFLRIVIYTIALVIDAIFTAGTIFLSCLSNGCIVLMYLLAGIGFVVHIT